MGRARGNGEQRDAVDVQRVLDHSYATELSSRRRIGPPDQAHVSKVFSLVNLPCTD